MKQFIKYAAVGIAGYFVGFYELKYRMLKLCVEKTLESDEKGEEGS